MPCRTCLVILWLLTQKLADLALCSQPEKLSALAAEEAATRAEGLLANADEDEIECALLEFGDADVLDLFDTEGGAFEMISCRRLMAEGPSSDEDESSDEGESGEGDGSTKQATGECDEEEEVDEEARGPSKQPRLSPPEPPPPNLLDDEEEIDAERSQMMQFVTA